MKLSKLLSASLVCGAALFTAACSDSDSNAKIVYQESNAICNAISCVDALATPADCIEIAQKLNNHLEAHQDTIKDAFSSWKGFDWADLLYGPVAALKLYQTQQAIDNCDDAGLEENKQMAANALQALTSIEGVGAAMTAAADRCANGGCENKK